MDKHSPTPDLFTAISRGAAGVPSRRGRETRPFSADARRPQMKTRTIRGHIELKGDEWTPAHAGRADLMARIYHRRRGPVPELLDRTRRRDRKTVAEEPMYRAVARAAAGGVQRPTLAPEGHTRRAADLTRRALAQTQRGWNGDRRRSRIRHSSGGHVAQLLSPSPARCALNAIPCRRPPHIERRWPTSDALTIVTRTALPASGENAARGMTRTTNLLQSV